MRIWQLPALAIAALMLAPLAVVAGSFLYPAGDVWQHIASFVLPRVTLNTIALTLTVGIATLLLGTATAWLTAVCVFPGRRFFGWALLLPLAMPGYVIAFALAGVFDYGGPVASVFRDRLGIALPELTAGAAVPRA